MKNTTQHPDKSTTLWSLQTSRTVISIAAGIVVGGVTALLLAPQSGSELRTIITDNTNKVTDDISEMVNSGIESIGNEGNKLKEQLTGTTNDKDLSSNSSSKLG